MTVLSEYVRAVQEGTADIETARNYYEGRVGEHFASDRLRRALRATGHRGSHNYCRIVVDAVLNRLSLANVVCDNPKASDFIESVRLNNEIDVEADEYHRWALALGDSYAMAWPDAEGTWQISFNDPSTTRIVYDEENPRVKKYAVKMWTVAADSLNGTAKHTRMNVYTPDAIHKYKANTIAVTEATDWTSLGSVENPFGEIPVFHFRTHRPHGRPEHLEAYGCQNDINKLLATHMFTVDYQGAPQRYALSMNGEDDVIDFDDNETERENMNALKSEPGSLWYLKGIHGVGEFSPADPKVFWEPISNLKQSMAALTDTPFHYLEKSINSSGGEYLRVAEAPLLKKVADRQASFGATWKELFSFILRIEGISTNMEVKWDLVESLDALGQWDVMLKKINAGLSHRQALREAGYEEPEIERIMAERAQEAAEGAYYQRRPEVRVSTDDNETFDNRNGLTEQAKDNGGRKNE